MLRLIMTVCNFELSLCFVCMHLQCNLAFRLSLCSMWLNCFVFLFFFYVQHFDCVMIVTIGWCVFLVLCTVFILCIASIFFWETIVASVNRIETMCLCSVRRGKDVGSIWCSWRLWRPVRRQRWVTSDLLPFSGLSRICVLPHSLIVFSFL